MMRNTNDQEFELFFPQWKEEEDEEEEGPIERMPIQNVNTHTTFLQYMTFMMIWYHNGKEFVSKFIGSNMAYSILYIIVVGLLMIYPLLELMWILVFRAIIGLAIVFIVKLGHKYVGSYIISCILSTWNKSTSQT
jgi:hypothetical protein